LQVNKPEKAAAAGGFFSPSGMPDHPLQNQVQYPSQRSPLLLNPLWFIHQAYLDSQQDMI
jgi:hypothetical protein